MAQDNPTKGFSLKDELFNEAKVRYLADLFSAADPAFRHDEFVNEVMQDLLSLELKARLQLIGAVLQRYLSATYVKAVDQILAALPPPLDPQKKDDDFGDFIFAPLGDFVARNGLGDFQTSMKAIEELTQRFSCEDPIRPFIDADPDQTYAQLNKWKIHSSYHVRRLVSEGTRPLLPWSARLTTDPKRAIPLLDHLYADPKRYVTRSVANHLNDIAKSDPDLVIETLQKWQSDQRQEAKELEWMTKHALRTLIKKGNSDALALLGYHPNPDVEITSFSLNPTDVPIGERTQFDLQITAHADEKILVDYVIDFVKANGSTAGKVFKLKQLDLKSGETVSLTKSHRFLKDATTFRLFAGVHKLSIQINGGIVASKDFTLT